MQLKYGQKLIDCPVTDATLIRSDYAPPSTATDAMIRTALANPIGSAPLRETVQTGESVVIVTINCGPHRGYSWMSESAIAGRRPAPLVLIVTGLSGAGRTTAINALEDLGYEALNNFPLSLFVVRVTGEIDAQALPSCSALRFESPTLRAGLRWFTSILSGCVVGGKSPTL